MTDLVIVGAGGHGREALAVARAASRAGTATWKILGFVDDAPTDRSRDRVGRLGSEVLGPVEIIGDTGADHVIAIGDPRTRRELDQRVGDNSTPAVLVDPTAWVGDDVELAPGVMLFPGSRCTTNVRVGRHSHLNCDVTVSHDSRVGDHVSLSPGVVLNGGVSIGDNAFLGTRAVVLPGCNVGDGAVIAAGAVVTEDVGPGLTMFGVPARPR